jgi:predicted ATPase/transcriptional regulator with XRE-family HTH domain
VFGELLRRHRIAAGLTQAGLAERGGLGIRSIQDLERGAHQPHRDTLQKLVHALNLVGEPRRQLEAATQPTPRGQRSQQKVKEAREEWLESGSTRSSQAAPTLSLSSNLPAQLTSFVGRERELGDITRLLAGAPSGPRLLTITGPAGVGKTRLAIEAVSGLVSRFADGVRFVPLAAIRDSGLVVSAIAESLGIREEGPRPVLDRLRAELREANRLLLLDNFEQVASAVWVIGDLLASCPRLKILVTTRSALRAYGEQEFPLAPLPLPNANLYPSFGEVVQSDAVRLFVERAQGVKPDFVLTPENVGAVVEICRRLDGLPLAIELAAARVRLFAPSALLDRLATRLKLLTGGAADRPARQQTLRNAIAWSYDLLEDEARAIFRRLCVFDGGFDLAGAEAVSGAQDVLDRIDALVSKSMVRLEEGEGEPRFSVLETIREFGRERLEESSEGGQIRQAHAGYFLALAEEADSHGESEDWAIWEARLDRERHDLRAALNYLVAAGDTYRSLRLACALFLYWRGRGDAREGSERIAAVLSLPPTPETSSLRVQLLLRAGVLAQGLGEAMTGIALVNESLEISRAAGDERSTARALRDLGGLHNELGDHETATRYLAESVGIYRRLGDRVGLAQALGWSANVALEWCDYSLASKLAAEASSLARELQLWRPLAINLRILAGAAHVSRNLAASQAAYEESARICRLLQAGRTLALALYGLGHLALERDDLPTARRYLREGLASHRDRQHPQGICLGLEATAVLERTCGHWSPTCRLVGASSALRQKMRILWTPLDQRKLSHAGVPRERPADDPPAAQAWDEGAAMSEEEAIAYALGLGDWLIARLELSPFRGFRGGFACFALRSFSPAPSECPPQYRRRWGRRSPP